MLRSYWFSLDSSLGYLQEATTNFSIGYTEKTKVAIAKMIIALTACFIDSPWFDIAGKTL